MHARFGGHVDDLLVGSVEGKAEQWEDEDHVGSHRVLL